ncbi:hypothetical protein BDD12DRAFT_896940 [Trichophaea hybrida]|nr:hypothetical protein BDD12DRAFT_896940 [Trichophaea hybrida]
MSRQQRPRVVIDPTLVSPGPPPNRPLPTPPGPPGQSTARLSHSSAAGSLSLGLPTHSQPQERVQSALLPMSPRVLVGSAPQSSPPQQNRIPSEINPATTPTPPQREPGYFDSNLAHSPSRRPLAVDENIRGLQGTPSLQRQNLELSPQRLHDPLHRIGAQHGDITGTRASLNSDVSISSITPSEAEMMSGGLAIDSRGRARFGGTSMDMPIPLHDEERFSTVPTIFDVAPREGSHQGSNQTPGGKGSRTTTAETDPFFDVPGSHTPSTRPDMPTSSSQLHVKPAPIFSLTAEAATGQEVISGNKTLEKSSVGSDETAPRKRHYEGCMLCSPLPSPSSSISSYIPDGPVYSPSDQRGSGPPPDAPLPDLVPQTTPRKGHRAQVDRSIASEFNPLKPYLELEGEVAAYDQCEEIVPTTPSVSVPPAALLGEPGPDYFAIEANHDDPPYATELPLYAHPVHGGSLSTLIEGDEESHITQSRQPSHREARSSHEAGQRMRSFSGEHNRPQTSGSTIGTHSAELSRSPTHANNSQHSLLGTTDLPLIPPIPASRAGVSGKSRNPFKRDASTLSAIQEAGISPRRSSWRGVFGREESPSQRTVPGTDTNDIELQSTPAFQTQSIHTAGAIIDPHPGQRVDRLDGAYEVVDLSGPSGDGATADAIQTPMRRKKIQLLFLRAGLDRIRKLNFKDSGRCVSWSLMGFGVAVLVMIITIPVVYVGFPAMAQKAINRANVDISSLSITGAKPNSVDLLIELKFLSDVQYDPYGEYSDFQLIAKNTNSSDQKKFASNIPGRTTQPNLLGWLQKPKSKALVSDAEKVAKLIGNDGGRFKIQDVNAWGKVLEALAYEKGGVEVDIQGQIKIQSGGLKALVNLEKTVSLAGIGGLYMDVTKYDVLKGNKYFTVQFDLQSNSSTRIEFGRVNFELLFGLTPIGNATIQQFAVLPGNKTMTARGSLSNDAMRNNPELLGKFLSSLFIRTNNNPTTALSLKGVNATVDGQEIRWLNSAVKKLQIPLPAVNGGPQENVLGSFDMGLSIVLNQRPAVTNGYISSNLNLPFASRGFDALIHRVGHSLELSTDGRSAFAVVALPVSPATVMGGKVAVAYQRGGQLTIKNGTAWSEGFLKPLIQSPKFTVSVGGNLTTDVATSLGNATIRDISLQQTTWNVDGYGLAGGKVPIELNFLNIIKGSGDGLHMAVKIKLKGTGDVELKFGEVLFQTSYKSSSQPIGNLTISEFTLSNGTNTYDGLLALNTAKEHQSSFNAFLTTFVTGGTIDLQLDAPSASKNIEVANALHGLEIPTSIASLGYTDSFVRKTELLLYGKKSQTLKGAVEFHNPFPIPMAIHGFTLTIKLTEGDVTVGKMDQVVFESVVLQPGESIVLDSELIGGVNITETKVLFFEGSVGREVYVEGRTAVGLGTNSGGIVDLQVKMVVKLSMV